MHYLDHAASAPALPEALAAFADWATRGGNPSSLHAVGRAARAAVEDAREAVAGALGAHPGDVVLTSGGTEADNLAVLGLARAARAADPDRRRILVSAVEHPAVLDSARAAGREGFEVVVVPVDAAGRVDLAALAAALAAPGATPALVSVMWANNEVGTVQPVAEVAALARSHGAVSHADAVQAVGAVPVDLAAAGLDALTLSGHKIGAPVGIGALLVRREVPIAAVSHGGGQERGVRSGTVPGALAVALGVAVTTAVTRRPETAVRVAGLRDALLAGALAAVPDAVLRGPAPGPDRLPGNALLTVPGTDSEALLFLLDAAGVAASAGSACRAGVIEPSHVLAAMGVPPEEARGAVRLTLGPASVPEDVAAFLAAWPDVVGRARAARARP